MRLFRRMFDVTDDIVKIMIGLFIGVLFYVYLLKDWITNNLTGTVQTMVNIAIWFVFISVALTAIYGAIKKGKK